MAGPYATAIAAAMRGEVVVLGRLGFLRVQPRPSEPGMQATLIFRPSRTIERMLGGVPSSALDEHALAAWLARPLELEVASVNAVKLASSLARECPLAQPLLDEVERSYAQKTHVEICRGRGLPPGVVFASITDADVEPEDQDHWALIFSGPDPSVIRTQGDRGREVRLSHWLGAIRALTALDELAGERVLSPHDLRRVVAHLDAYAPGVAYVWDDFPY
jgi:hypothetical protein